MIQLTGNYVFDLKINGEPYPFTPGCLRSFKIIDDMKSFTTIAELLINDKGNNLVELLPLTGNETVTISIGPDIDTLEDIEFNVVAFPMKNIASNSPQGSLVKLILVSTASQKLMKQVVSESYSNKRISAVVETLLSKNELKQGFIEATKGVGDWFIPKWTYAQFIRYLSSKAISQSKDISGYNYFINMFSEFSFCSYDYLYSQSLSDERKYLQGIGENDDEKQKEILDIEMTNSYLTVLLQGGFGVYAPWFDYENTEFHIDSVTPGNIKHGALTPRLIVNSDAISPRRMVHTTRKESIPYEERAAGENFVLRRLNSILGLSLLLRGDSSIRLGEKVRVVLPSTNKDFVYNDAYSGDWIINKVTHYFNSEEGGMYFTRVDTFRNGLDFSGDTSLLQPQGGHYVS